MMRGLVLCSVLAIATVAIALGEWNRSSVLTSEDDDYENANVGNVLGWVGGLEAFQTTNEGSGFKTTGKVGCVWNGVQFDAVSEPDEVEKTNWVKHGFTREQEGGSSTHDVGVLIDSSVTVSGSASEWDIEDPQWWWDTRSTIRFLGVSVRVYDVDTEEWGDLEPINTPGTNWPNAGINDGGAGAAGDAKNNNSQTGTSTMSFLSSPTHTTDDNAWAYETTDNMTKITITAQWKSEGRPASVDNASVSNERHQLAFTMTSWTS